MTDHPLLCSPLTPSSGHRSGRAFTLIELLICVSIIVLLVTLLVPAVQKARYAAMAAACGANLHSLTQLMAISAENNGGLLPTSLSALSSTASSTIQARGLYCPRTINDPLYGNAIYYGANMFTNAHMTAMSIPSQTVFAGDEGGWQSVLNRVTNIGNGNGGAAFVLPSQSLALSNLAPDFDGLHSGTGNIAWYDGHVSREAPMIPTKLPAGFTALDDMPIYHYGYLTPVPIGTTYSNFANSSKNPASVTDYYFLFNK